MTLIAHSFITQEPTSLTAGEKAGLALHTSFGNESIQAVIAYATVNHDQPALLRGLRKAVGEHPIIIGCSTQGVTGQRQVIEQGYASGFMAIGGAGVEASSALVSQIQTDTREKGLQLAQGLLKNQSNPPRAVVLLWDPLSGVDVPELVRGLKDEIQAPIIGGAASQPWGPMVQTFQYLGQEVISHGAVAIALGGPFDVHMAHTHGAAQAGIEMMLTRVEGNRILELDGKPALDVWSDMIGGRATNSVDDTAAWAIGVKRDKNQEDGPKWSVLAAFGFDHDAKAVVLQSSVPEGTVLMFHHRTVEAVLEGAMQMGELLQERLAEKTVRAVLGFECGARTSPFLGPGATTQENASLQECVAPEAAWLGMLAWGELVPVAETSTFCNYTYPIMALCDR